MPRRRKPRRKRTYGGGWPALWYTLRKARGVGLLNMWRALRSRNACKTCALGMGGQLGGMVNERGRFPEVCKKSVQAMAADLQGPIHPHFFSDLSLEQLKALSSRELEAAGRLTQPLYAGPLDSHYRQVSWEQAIDIASRKLRKTDPHQAFFYFSGRSSNEAGFLMQLFARLWGTNNVNNCSYYCHQASGVGLNSVLGSGTATITLEDLELIRKNDVLWLIGANPASNHPRFMRTLVDIKRRGGKVIVINPIKEIGLVKFRVPSDVRSLLFGSKIADLYLQPHIGGDIALLTGVLKVLLEQHPASINRAYLQQHTQGWPEVERSVRDQSWETILQASGVARPQIELAAQLYAQAPRSVFCWAMGVTHHRHGVENVQMIANLALARGMVGSPGCGLLPLRGHSNVQGIGSMGVAPQLKEAVFAKLQSSLGVRLPDWPGWDTLTCMQQAQRGNVRFASCLGGNLFGSNPDAKFAHSAMSAIDMVMYISTTLNTGHAWGRGRETLILPALTRDEEHQSTTQESMFNYVRLSDGAHTGNGVAAANGQLSDEKRSEVDIIASLARATLGQEHPVDFSRLSNHAALREMIASIIPGYEQLGQIDRTRKEFTISGRVLHQPRFATPSGKAHMHVVEQRRQDTEAPRHEEPETGISASSSRPSMLARLRLMTIRSEGQFNTVVYEEEDIYRGQERRDVILMNERDIERSGLQLDQRVTVESRAGILRDILVRQLDIPQGNCAMYYPEANVLVEQDADSFSRTPAFKSTVVWIKAQEGSEKPGASGSDVARPPAPVMEEASGSSRNRMSAC